MKWLRRALAVVLALFAGVGLAEVVVRVGGYDMNMLGKGLYYAHGYGEVHESDPDPLIHYRLKPKSSIPGVHINTAGARGPERSVEKAADLYRIVVVGGSNVFGDRLTDDQAWPAQLERALNERSATKFEVWNFGTPAYVPSQMVVIAEEAIERLRPDLVIFALSNKGTRAFLQDDDLRRHFGGNSANWAYFLTPDVLTWPEELPYETNLALVKASALYRLGVLYQLLDQEERRIVHQPAHEQANVDATHRFLREAVGRTRVMIFVPPSSTREEFSEYYDDNTPLMVLNADDKPAEYRDVHGPAPVMAWYGDRIADWLFAQDWFKIATANEAPTERNE